MDADSFPYQIREIENLFIRLAGGDRLAARVWLPDGSDVAPVPAILEYLPYRKRDFMRKRDEQMHRYFAGHGYAALRVDIRGSGDSDGVLRDEYLASEHADALEVIAWIAAQSWCDGSVGMTGISWGGFNSLQVAALRPPALKAIISLCASDDRYADDAHFMGGCLLNENQIWGTALFAMNALPPDPAIVGEQRWRTLWHERLEANRPFPALWLQHPHRDAYWEHGSVCEDFGRIECPVYAIGGWADGYSNAIPRLLAGLRSPCKGLIGPWAHTFPHNGMPGPAIGYLQEPLRSWGRWLKRIPNGIDEEPALRVWMQHGAEPTALLGERPGQWVAEAAWPSGRIKSRTLYMAAARGGSGSLTERPGSEPAAALEIRSAQSTGVTAGVWCEFGGDGEAPRDQRPDDGRSLVFDSAPLDQPLAILGAPRVHLRIAANQPVAMVALRLNEVFETGASARVSYGVLNLAHRCGHARPRPVVPGQPMDVAINLNDVAHRFEPGSSLRLALSTVYWPTVWPPPRPVTLSLFCAGCSLSLPVREPDPNDALLAPFAAPDSAAPSSQQRPLEPTHYVRTLERDLTRDRVTYRMVSDGGDLDDGSVARIEDIDLELGHRVERSFRIGESDPLDAHAVVRERLLLRRGDWEVVVDAQTSMCATETEFLIDANLDATECGELVFSRRWSERVPRKLL